MIRSLAVAACLSSLFLAAPVLAQEVDPAEVAFIRDNYGADVSAQVDTTSTDVLRTTLPLVETLPQAAQQAARQSLERYIAGNRASIEASILGAMSAGMTIDELHNGFASQARQEEAFAVMGAHARAEGRDFGFGAIEQMCRDVESFAGDRCAQILQDVARLRAN